MCCENKQPITRQDIDVVGLMMKLRKSSFFPQELEPAKTVFFLFVTVNLSGVHGDRAG